MQTPIAPPLRPRAHFHLLAKPTGAVCNLDCKYCFFLSKEMLYPGSRFRMADELLETYLRQLLESQAGPEVCIAWQGGEPTLMGLDFFKRTVRVRRTPQEARPDAVPHHPDQRHASRRRVGGVLQAHKFSGRLEPGRPARDARRVSRRQGRPGHVRQRDARLGLLQPRTASTSTSSARCTPPTPTARSRCTGFSATSSRPRSSSSFRSSNA